MTFFTFKEYAVNMNHCLWFAMDERDGVYGITFVMKGDGNGYFVPIGSRGVAEQTFQGLLSSMDTGIDDRVIWGEWLGDQE